MIRILRTAALLLLLSVAPAFAGDGDNAKAKVQVVSSRQSALINVNITSFRTIGKVVIEVRDANGKTLYKEEGRALTPELVRRLDKGVFPKGELTLSVTAKDFAITQVFNCQ